MVITDITNLIRDKCRISATERPDAVLLPVVNAAYHDVCAMRLWSWRQANTTITTKAVYATGTVNVINGSATVAMTTGTVAAGMVGMKFKASSNWYTIGSIVTAGGHNDIVLTTTYNEVTNATATYTIFQDGYALPADFGLLYYIKQEGFQALQYLPLKTIEQEVSRWNLGTPYRYTIWGEKLIFDSIPSTVIQYNLKYWQDVADLNLSTNLTPIIPSQFQNVLVELGIAWERERNDENPDYNFQKAQLIIKLMMDEDENNPDYVETLGSNKLTDGIYIKTGSRVPPTYPST